MESMSFSSKRKNRMDKTDLEKSYFNNNGVYSRYRSEERRLKLKEEAARKATAKPDAQKRGIYWFNQEYRDTF